MAVVVWMLAEQQPRLTKSKSIFAKPARSHQEGSTPVPPRYTYMTFNNVFLLDKRIIKEQQN
jgi:hypothetical protein